MNEETTRIVIVPREDAKRIMVSLAMTQVVSFPAYRLRNGMYLVVIGESLDLDGNTSVTATIMAREDIEALKRERGVLVYEVECVTDLSSIERVLDVKQC